MQSFGKAGESDLFGLNVHDESEFIGMAISSQYRIAATYEQVSAKPAVHVQCLHSAVTKLVE